MLDYLIIGFGLAGSSLAHLLGNQAKSFLVFDDESQRASKVAGGLYNPVVLKRFTLAWQADEQLKFAIPFYKSLEEKLGTQLLKKLPIHRKFHSVEEQNDWFSAMDKPGLNSFLNPNLIQNHFHIPSRFLFGEVQQTGVLDTKKLLVSYSEYLTKTSRMKKERFDYEALEVQSDFIRYKGIQSKRIIFCEGFGITQNPFFNYLPLNGNKGEYIIIKAPNLKLREIIKSSLFIIPLKNDLYKVGATYERDFDNQLPTDSAKNDIIKKLEATIDSEYTIVEQVAGIRPTVPDRKPLVGKHPEFQNVFLCNGFGSRGVLIAPTVSKELVDFMEDGKPLSEEIDIRRFSGN